MDSTDDSITVSDISSDEKKKNNRKQIVFGIVSALVYILIGMILSPYFFNTQDLNSPSDILGEDVLEVWDNKICVLGSYEFARVSDTKSMDPVMDKNSILITQKIYNFSQISVGDIISYKSFKGNYVVHRVIKKVNNSYLRTKGDNNYAVDSQKVYPSMVHSVIVGIIY